MKLKNLKENLKEIRENIFVGASSRLLKSSTQTTINPRTTNISSIEFPSHENSRITLCLKNKKIRKN
jgi:hypothetical protein